MNLAPKDRVISCRFIDNRSNFKPVNKDISIKWDSDKNGWKLLDYGVTVHQNDVRLKYWF